MQEKDTTISQKDKGTMKRVLGIIDLISIGYGDLGSWIYYALGIAIFYSLGAAPLSLLIAGIVFVITSLTYAELSTMNSFSGGSVSFSKKTFNDCISFISGWGSLMDYIVFIAICLFSSTSYLSHFFPSLLDPNYKIMASIIAVVLLFFLNILGWRFSMRLCLLLTVITLITEVIIIVLGFYEMPSFSTVISKMRIGISSSFSPSWHEFWKGTAMAMVAYTGIESISQLSPEVKQPKKNLPKAIIITTIILLFLYLSFSWITTSQESKLIIDKQFLEQPLLELVKSFSIYLPWFLEWIAILGVIVLFVAANAAFLGASRLSFYMGEHFQLPRFLFHLSEKNKIPVLALLSIAIFSIGTLIISRAEITILADLYNFGAMIAFFFAHVSLIIMRVRYPEEKAKFTVPFNIKIKDKSIPILPIIGALASLAVWILVVIVKPYGRMLGSFWLIFGLVIYTFYRRKKKMSLFGTTHMESVKFSKTESYQFSHLAVVLQNPEDLGALEVACKLAKAEKKPLEVIIVVVMPFSFPLYLTKNVKSSHKTSLYKKAEALLLEYGLPNTIERCFIRRHARELKNLLKKKKVDLALVGFTSSSIKSWVQYLLTQKGCRYLLYR